MIKSESDESESYIGIGCRNKNHWYRYWIRSDWTFRALFTLRRQSVKKDTVRILQECKRQAIDHVVVGLPLQLDGTEGRSAKLARQIGSAITADSSYEVSYCDERFSTVEASRRLRESGKAAEIKKRLLIKRLRW